MFALPLWIEVTTPESEGEAGCGRGVREGRKELLADPATEKYASEGWFKQELKKMKELIATIRPRPPPNPLRIRLGPTTAVLTPPSPRS